MPDEGLVPEDLGSGFVEQFREAQAEARAARDAAVEAKAETPVVSERPRDEAGRFAPSGETDPDPDPDGDTPAEATAQELILGKFKSHDDVIEAYSNLERRLAAQGDELAEARRAAERLEQIEQRLQSWEESPEPVDPGYFDKLFDQNPGQAIAEAIQAGYLPDSPVYERLMDAWVEEDPKAARIDTKIRAALQQQMYEERLQELQAPIMQTRIQSEFTQAYQQVATRVPDIDQLPMQEAAKQPFFQQAIQNARSVEERASVLEAMTVFARGLAIPSIQQASVQFTEAAEAEHRRQRDMAVVASSQHANVEPPSSREDQLRERIRLGALEWTSDHKRGLTRDAA